VHQIMFQSVYFWYHSSFTKSCSKSHFFLLYNSLNRVLVHFFVFFSCTKSYPTSCHCDNNWAKHKWRRWRRRRRWWWSCARMASYPDVRMLLCSPPMSFPVVFPYVGLCQFCHLCNPQLRATLFDLSPCCFPQRGNQKWWVKVGLLNDICFDGYFFVYWLLFVFFV
jgi:hypothetical protein